MLGDIRDNLIAIKDEVISAPRLPHLAIDIGFELQLMRIADNIGRYKIRTNRREIIKRFAKHPLAAALQLEIARREIVGGAISCNVVRSIGLGDVARLLTHDDQQFSLVIKLHSKITRRKRDRAVVSG